MKKQYISPNSKCIIIKLSRLIASSDAEQFFTTGNTVKTNQIVTGGDASQAASRRSVWDDDDE